MRPHPRGSPRTASAANNLQTNPARTNNQRDPYPERSSPYSDSILSSGRRSDAGDDDMRTLQEMEWEKNQKVNQVIQASFDSTSLSMDVKADHIQNFFTKAALSIVSSRYILDQSLKNGQIRQNKWV